MIQSEFCRTWTHPDYRLAGVFVSTVIRSIQRQSAANKRYEMAAPQPPLNKYDPENIPLSPYIARKFPSRESGCAHINTKSLGWAT
jgi:hypothetical protein